MLLRKYLFPCFNPTCLAFMRGYIKKKLKIGLKEKSKFELDLGQYLMFNFDIRLVSRFRSLKVAQNAEGNILQQQN